MEFLELYSPIIKVKINTSGILITKYEDAARLKGSYGPVFDAWLGENDVEELSMISTNFGTSLTATKFSKEHHNELLKLITE
jgi:hypothetical protein